MRRCVRRREGRALSAHPIELEQFLVSHGLLKEGAPSRWTALSGGVSSDVWRVESSAGICCVKQALERLKVAAEWRVPRTRSSYEWAYLCFAAECVPGSVPRPLAHDADLSIIAMEFLEPGEFPVWKQQLMDRQIDEMTAHGVGVMLGRLHALSAHSRELSHRFDTLENFRAIRLEPYLLATAHRHPDRAGVLNMLAARTAAFKVALVHGDVSPKNILVGSRGPVLLDAECAWFGDPAFDVAFCLTHLLLKCLVHPDIAARYLNAFAALFQSYLPRINWEDPALLEQRAASLLPGLLLARIDGKSPVDYLAPSAQEQGRAAARSFLAQPPARLDELAQAWRDMVRRHAQSASDKRCPSAVSGQLS
jgi:aminoglycoside phosphotransferase (APT) family kinase protein